MNAKIKFTFLVITLTVSTVVFSSFKKQQKDEPWTQQQLLEPADLVKTINNPQAKQPYIYSIGPGAIVKNSIDIGSAQDRKNLNKFKEAVSKLPKDADIVIYCGCCPFDKCPNIRPVFTLLNEMKFTNQKLLNLPHNIKMDWIDNGYPVNNRF